ncbi:MAG: DUF4272 domain-containing protein [Pirellulaceae bacterium]|nr:DUF4272 domain-containing protein [Pirellulaceae bacterium]
MMERRLFLAQTLCCLPAALAGCGARDVTDSHREVERAASEANPNGPANDDSPRRELPAEIDLQAIRVRNLSILTNLGFRVADNLPLCTQTTLRPVEEIGIRLMALDAVYTWAYAIEEKASSERLRAYADRNGLWDAMTEEDCEVFQMPRDQARRDFGGTVGWCLENMWPLAWALGFDSEPPLSSDSIPDAIANSLIMQFMPKLDATLEDFIDKARLRESAKVVSLHDLYYCAHNAVRSAQLGRETVPKGFDVLVGGRSVQERRHALTWILSPGVAWDDTDLST